MRVRVLVIHALTGTLRWTRLDQLMGVWTVRTVRIAVVGVFLYPWAGGASVVEMGNVAVMAIQ